MKELLKNRSLDDDVLGRRRCVSNHDSHFTPQRELRL
jgi:hypothetical protein